MATVTATSQSCTSIPSQGFYGRTCGLPSTKNHLRQRLSRSKAAAFTVISSKFELKPPPYPLDALEPHMSRETLEYHWGKHHRTYVENLNKQITGTNLEELSLENAVLVSYNKGNMLPAFNNAAQAWNHEFFWESMQPSGGGKPSGELLNLIKRDFGSFEIFLEKFKSAAATQFGSGWAWLAYKANRLDVENAVNPLPSEEDKRLVIVKSPNAVNPLVWDYFPLLTIDVWEHAYYLDFENRRLDYISMFMDKLVSWEAVSSRLQSAMAAVEEREKEEQMGKTEEDDGTDEEVREVYLDGEGDADESATE